MYKLDIEECKKITLDILIKIDKICRKNNFVYMICYGTLLGAIRHKGYIPWDDDIDIIMPREDYYKLGEYIIKHPELGLNYIDVSNRKDTIYYCAKICDKSTTVEESNFKHVEGYGLFVDVFPMDYLPEEERKRKRNRKKEMFWIRMIQHSSKISPGKGKNLKESILRMLAFILSRGFNAGKMLEKMHCRYIESNLNATNYIGIPWDKDEFKPSWLNDQKDILFEGHEFLAPCEPEKVLETIYGDYMTLPPVNERKCKHGLNCYKIDGNK